MTFFFFFVNYRLSFIRKLLNQKRKLHQVLIWSINSEQTQNFEACWTLLEGLSFAQLTIIKIFPATFEMCSHRFSHNRWQNNLTKIFHRCHFGRCQVELLSLFLSFLLFNSNDRSFKSKEKVFILNFTFSVDRDYAQPPDKLHFLLNNSVVCALK